MDAGICGVLIFLFHNLLCDNSRRAGFDSGMCKLFHPAKSTLAVLLLLSIAPLHALGQQPVIFSEEFNGASLDTSRWMVEKRAGNNAGTPKGELQFYMPDAVSLSGGVLHITASQRETVDSRTQLHLQYVSARIQSKQTFLYGHFEFKAKLPRGRGLWPALWLRTPPTLPLDGEIDVLEGYGSHPNMIQSTMHPWVNGVEPHQYAAWLFVQPKPDSPRFHRPEATRVDNVISLPRDLASDFHIYAIDWQPDHITWSLDGVPYFTVRERIPTKPMFIIMQMPLSINWDGLPDSTTSLPQSLDVDYVRVSGSQIPHE